MNICYKCISNTVRLIRNHYVIQYVFEKKAIFPPVKLNIRIPKAILMDNHTTNQVSLSVTKQSGERVPFDPEQLKRSLLRAGAGEEDVRNILEEIAHMLYDGIPTRKIYRRAHELLRKRSSGASARYKLKQAIQELGPTGYPFEKYVAALLAYQGYKVRTDQILEGRCVSHEVDVVAEKEEEVIMVECKFHSEQGTKSDVKVPMYIRSRFEDIRNNLDKYYPGRDMSFHGWVVTNTRFTEDAIDFGRCSGLYLLSWDYPGNGSLRERIDLAGLHPVTCLHNLTRREKKELLGKEVVLVKELLRTPGILETLGIPPPRIRKLIQEAESLFIPRDKP